MSTPTRSQLAKLESQVTTFNKAYKVGDKVKVWSILGVKSFVDEIKHPATLMGGHTAVTWLVEKGSYDLTFVKELADE